MHGFWAGICAAMLLGAAGQSQQAPGMSNGRPAADAQITIEAVPPAVAQRAGKLRGRLKKPAAVWIDQQAAIEAQKKVTDLEALRGAVRERFSRSFQSASKHARTTGSLSADADVEAVVFMVLSEAAQQQQTDLESTLQQMDALNRQKQALRELDSEAQQSVAGAKAKQRDKTCSTPFCKSLASRLAAVSGMSVPGEVPLHTRAPQKLTYAELEALQAEMEQDLDSMNEMSEMTSMRLQMAMDRRSKFVEALSNIMKSIEDTQDSIVQNLK